MCTWRCDFFLAAAQRLTLFREISDTALRLALLSDITHRTEEMVIAKGYETPQHREARACSGTKSLLMQTPQQRKPTETSPQHLFHLEARGCEHDDYVRRPRLIV